MFVALLGDITGAVTGIMHSMGFAGIFILTIIEGIGLPIPSEIVMPYGGFLAIDGDLPHLLLVSLIGSLGMTIGSTIDYAIARWGGRALINRYGRYLRITPEKMSKAERFFHKYGELACIFTRLLPVVRSLVNFPAGLLKMNFYKFAAYTMIGSFPWCFGLASAGYLLGDNWESILGMAHTVTYAFIGLLGVLAVACVILYIYVRRNAVMRQRFEKLVASVVDI